MIADVTYMVKVRSVDDVYSHCFFLSSCIANMDFVINASFQGMTSGMLTLHFASHCH